MGTTGTRCLVNIRLRRLAGQGLLADWLHLLCGHATDLNDTVRQSVRDSEVAGVLGTACPRGLTRLHHTCYGGLLGRHDTLC